MTPAGQLALRSVGFGASTPVRASRVVQLPPVGDVTGITATSSMLRRSRVDIVVSTQRKLLDELRSHAGRVAAAGIIDIHFAQLPTPFRARANAVGDVVELVASAVPITTGAAARPQMPFRSAIDAVGFVELLGGGWVPVDVVVAGTTQTRSQQHRARDAEAATGTTNREMPGPTDMIQRARRLLRERLSGAARSLGADGLLLHGGFDVTWSSTYHLVQVSAVGNAIARFDRGYSRPTMTLPLRGHGMDGVCRRSSVSVETDHE